MTSSANVTLYTLSLVSADPVTGWYGREFSSGTIKMVIRPRGSSFMALGIGYYARYDVTGFTVSAVYEGDMIKDANNVYYLVKSVQEEWWLDTFSHYVCELVKSEFADQPTSSGTWHLDSESVKTDPRYRHKTYLDSYITDGNLKEDNGSTNVTWRSCFDGAPYPFSKIFLTKNIDLVFSISKEDAKPRLNYEHYPYAFDETVSITVYAVNKSGITATNLIEQAEQEIRHVVTDHPLGSIRSIESITHKPVDLGSTTLYSTTVKIKYTRINDDLVPTYPTVTYGSDFIYEGDKLDGGAEGTWWLATGGSTITQTIDSENNVDLNLTTYVDDAYMSNGTDLRLSTTVYPRIRFAYKTTGNAQAKIIIVFSDATLQTVLAAASSTIWVVGDVALTAAKTVDHIHFYAATGVGHVYYDFAQIYKGNYVLPNVVNLAPPVVMNEAVIEVPGRFGSIDQVLGTKSMEVTLTCDLDMEPPLLTWKRPQTSTPKTDYNNLDILLELLHYQTQLWQWLDLGNPSLQMKVRLVELRPALTGESNRVELVFREYRHGTAGNMTATERWGLSL
jgi:hypothetical protein